jgi:hypothetical protein
MDRTRTESTTDLTWFISNCHSRSSDRPPDCDSGVSDLLVNDIIPDSKTDLTGSVTSRKKSQNSCRETEHLVPCELPTLG